MRKLFASIGRMGAVLILVLELNLGCGTRAQDWAIGMGFDLASYLVNAVSTVAIQSLLPSTGTTTTTVSTTSTKTS